jgi:membrane protease YdiL (CAAX protease family)
VAYLLLWLLHSALAAAPPLVEAVRDLGVDEYLFAAMGGLIAAVVAALIVQHGLGGPTLGQLGLVWQPRSAPDLALGLVLGLALFGLVFDLALGLRLVLVAPGAATFRALVEALVTLTAVAFAEELVMRGVLFQQLHRGWGLRPAVLGSSGLFAAFHLPNVLSAEVDPVVGVLALAVLAALGVVWALAAWWTRALWLPIAWHLSWNYAQGPIYGFPVSGNFTEALVELTPRTAHWATGGMFGPEGGLLGLLAVGLGAAILWGYTAQRNP